jgi:hypothetical protein
MFVRYGRYTIETPAEAVASGIKGAEEISELLTDEDEVPDPQGAVV